MDVREAAVAGSRVDGRRQLPLFWWTCARNKLRRERPVPPGGSRASKLQQVESRRSGSRAALVRRRQFIVEIAGRFRNNLDARDRVRSPDSRQHPNEQGQAATNAPAAFRGRSNNSAALLPGGQISIVRQVAAENLMGETETSIHRTLLRDEIIQSIRGNDDGPGWKRATRARTTDG